MFARHALRAAAAAAEEPRRAAADPRLRRRERRPAAAVRDRRAARRRSRRRQPDAGQRADRAAAGARGARLRGHDRPRPSVRSASTTRRPRRARSGRPSSTSGARPAARAEPANLLTTKSNVFSVVASGNVGDVTQTLRTVRAAQRQPRDAPLVAGAAARGADAGGGPLRCWRWASTRAATPSPSRCSTRRDARPGCSAAGPSRATRAASAPSSCAR